MRGPDEQTSDMFSYLSPEQRVRPDHPLRAIRRMTDEVLRGAVAALREDVLGHRPAVDSAGAVAAGAAAAVALHGPQRAAADGRDRLQRAVSLVCRARDGRADLVADDLQQEPRPAAGERHRRARSSMRWSRRRATAGLLVGRAFHGRRDAAGGVGQPQELPARRTTGPTPPPDDPGNPTVNFHGETRRNDTHQSTTDPDAHARAQGPGQGSEAGVRGPRAARQSPWLGGECLRHRRHRDRRTRGRLAVAGRGRATRRRSAATRASTSPSFVAGVRALGDHAARRAEGHGQRDRRPDHAACRATRSANRNGS